MLKYLILSFGMAGNLAFSATAEDLAIIVAKSSALSDVTSAELTKIFKCEKTKGPGGAKLAVVVQSGGSEHEAALAAIYKTDDAGYKKYFLQATFTGALSAAPKALSSGDAVKSFVTTTPGGIGYTKASVIDDTVKALKVDGKAPGEAGYPIQLK